MLVLPKCRKVAEQLSENIDEPITGFKKFLLKLHLKMCSYCQRYGKQIELSSKTIDSLNTKATHEESLPDDDLKKKVVSDYKKIYGQGDKHQND